MEAITTAFSTAFANVSTQAFAILAIAIPIALGIGAAIFISRKGFGWFKSMTKA